MSSPDQPAAPPESAAPTEPAPTSPAGSDSAPATGPGPALPPAPPRSGPPIALFVAISALFAVGVAVVMSTMGGQEQAAAPAEASPDRPAPPPQPTGPGVELALFVEQGEELVEVTDGTMMDSGLAVVFELSAEEQADVRVWVEMPGQSQAEIGTFEATPEAGLLSTEDGLLAYSLATTGTAMFKASSTAEGCPPAACDTVVITVR